MIPTISTVPPDSVIYQRLQGASFYDCHAMDIPPTDKSALALYLQVVADTPGWVNALMALRNRAVAAAPAHRAGNTAPGEVLALRLPGPLIKSRFCRVEIVHGLPSFPPSARGLVHARVVLRHADCIGQRRP